MKTNTIVRIVLFSLAIVVLSSILLGILCVDRFMVDGTIDLEVIDSVETQNQEQTQKEFPSDIQNIDIAWVAGTITVMEDSSVQNILVKEYSTRDNADRMICKQSGKTLEIQFQEESVTFFGIGNHEVISKDLIVLVPTGWTCSSLEIDGAAADVHIQNIRMKELDFDGASGKLNVQNCDIDSMEIETASGDVEFYGILNKLDFDAASAKFVGQFYRIPERLTLNAMSGDVILTLPEDSGFTLELDALSGSFDSDFTFRSNDSLYECGDGACNIRVSGLSGDVSIHKGISQPENCDH